MEARILRRVEIGTDRVGALGAVRHRDFRLLWTGQTLSMIGDGAFLVATGWRVVQLTGSSSSLAILLALNNVAMLSTLLVGGALADRYPRRLMMIVSDLVRCACVASLAALDATGQLSFGIWLALAVVYGLGDGFFQPAFGGIVPLVVEPEAVPSANALIGIARNTSLLVGPALAGLLYGIAGSPVVFGANAATFVVSALLLLLARPRPIEPEPSEGTWREIVSGFRYVARVPWLWVTISLAAVALMIAWAPFQSLLPALTHETFHRGVASYGTLFAVQALGMVGGALLFGQIQPRRHRVVLTYAAYGLNDICVIVLVVLGSYHAAVVLMVARGALIGWANALWETILVQLVPENRLSRVISLDYFGTLGLTPVGFALTAAVAPFFPAASILLVGYSLATVLWMAPLASRRVRSAA
jgi:MFS family permease